MPTKAPLPSPMLMQWLYFGLWLESRPDHHATMAEITDDAKRYKSGFRLLLHPLFADERRAYDIVRYAGNGVWRLRHQWRQRWNDLVELLPETSPRTAHAKDVLRTTLPLEGEPVATLKRERWQR